MVARKYFFLCIIFLITCFAVLGCQEQNKVTNDLEIFNDDIQESANNVDEKRSEKNTITVEDSDIAEILMYDPSRDIKFLYVTRLKIFEEFGAENEGFILLDPSKNILTFGMTKATGTITGAVDGPHLHFELDFENGKIINKEFTPAPDYEKYGKPEFAEHSNEIIKISDERIVEIGIYFKELMDNFQNGLIK